MNDPINMSDALGLRIEYGSGVSPEVMAAFSRIRSTAYGKVLYDILDKRDHTYMFNSGPFSIHGEGIWEDKINIGRTLPRSIEFGAEDGSSYCDRTSTDRMVAHELGEIFGVTLGLDKPAGHSLAVRIENSIANSLGDLRRRKE
jgi:hypothetical protein